MPGPGDDVTIAPPDGVNVIVDRNGSMHSLTLGAGVTLTERGNRTLTVLGGSTTVSAGDVTLDVDLAGTTLVKSGAGTLTLLQPAALSGAVTVSAGRLALQDSLDAASLALAAGATLGVSFTRRTAVSAVNLNGSATLAGALDIDAPNGINLGRSPFTVVSSSGGTVDITGLFLGSAPTGYAFGFRVVGTSFVLDVARQPIAVDGTGSATGTCGSTLSWLHTVGPQANDRYLLVGISTGNAGGSVAPTSVTYGAQTLGLLGSASNAAGSSRVFLYGLLAPARGANTITVGLPAGPCAVVAGSVSYTGVNQATPTRTAASTGGAGNTGAVTVSTGQGDKVISVVSSNTAASGTPQTGATIRWAASRGTELGAASTVSRTGTGTLAITMSWTLGPPGSSEWALVAIPIRAVNPTRAAEHAPVVRRSAQGAKISFRAGPSSDLVGFRIWRDSTRGRELLTRGLVAGPVLVSRATLLAGSDLDWVDLRPVPGGRYWVEALRLDGATEWAPATETGGGSPASASSLVGEPAAVLREESAVRIAPADPPRRSTAPAAREVQWQLAAAGVVKIVVAQPGVVRVSAETLFAAGMPASSVASSVQLFRGGRPVPRRVLAADGRSLRPGDAVEFYGYGMDTRYSGSAVYWLTAGRGAGRDLGLQSPSTTEVGATTFLAAAEIRERLIWFGAVQNGDAEKFFGPAVYLQPRERTLTLEGVDTSAAGARLEVALQGVTEVRHEVSLTVNGLAVGILDFDGQALGAARIDLPPGVLVPGDNLVGLVAAGSSDLSLEQFVRIVYPRRTARGSGALELTVPGGSATRLEGFDPTHARVLDVTDPDVPVQLATWAAPAGGTAVTAPGIGPRRLIAYLPEDATAPASVAADRPSSWHSAEGADLVVIGPSGLSTAVQPLADRRRAEGLSVAVVDIEDVQDEFASGEKSAESIRDFLAHALRTWPTPPRWVLLLGSGTYDPRDYLGLGGDLVPTGIVQTESLEAASDSWFLDVPGAEAVSIGRLPVRTTAETEAVVAKILSRRPADARSAVLLVSDASGTSDFPEMTSDLRANLPGALTTVFVRGSQPDDALHQQVLEAARAGPALVNYTGHASETFWSGNLHSIDDAPALAGGGTSLWVHMTCLTAFFQDPRRQSLAVSTLLSPSGGAWGAWGSTALTYPSEHPMLDRALVKAVLVDGRTLGEATRAALDGTSDADLQSTFVLLGDPSARAVGTSSSALTGPAPGSSSGLGCSTPGRASTTVAALMGVALWLGASRRRITDTRRS
ncbi:MAG TPA: C25 family cysteine peptidase [Myxococcaceae bacterium]|nr:C25 family cysteine peptidase [Myxococcaceae bacterium]